MEPLADRFGRPLTDLRVSVTDRCNFRCRYCMPREVFGADHAFLPRSELLSFEEIRRVVAAFTDVGVTKVRLTGGEPLLRRDLPDLVAMLSSLEGLDDLALTTNGTALARLAEPLRAAGLGRVTVSLDALDDAVHRTMADTPTPVAVVLDGIAAAQAAGFDVKINTVVKRGVNTGQVPALADYARTHGVTVRFIEYMDVGATNGWRLDDVVSADEILTLLAARWPVDPVPPATPGQVAETFAYRDGAGRVGVIASVTRPFCATCSRARLSSLGEVFTCLFATRGHDLRAAVRGGATRAALAAEIAGLWRVRGDRYSQLRAAATPASGPGDGDRVEMSYIGG